ncbi:MAG: hypothetical protein LBQ01_07050 [Prevotellaceae bacterium]|jgi:hypothetical protein|nr:hypothetical protein [Prevotellaceae bacterium]
MIFTKRTRQSREEQRKAAKALDIDSATCCKTGYGGERKAGKKRLFIMYDLVAIYHKIKKYRQVIIISHSANLAVNADSGQVIITKEDGILKYISVPLENRYINEQICKILDGGQTALLNREKKCGFKK